MHGLLGYREVIETIAWGLSQLGHPVSVGENEFRPAVVNILFGAQMLSDEDLLRLPAETVVYNFEQIGGLTARDMKPQIRIVADRFRIWDYSAANIVTWHRLNGASRALHVPVGWAPVLERIPRADAQDIDVLLYGSPSPLRMEVVTALCERGVKCVFACGLYGRARDDLIARSKLVLNVNKRRSRIFEVVRVSYLLANGKAVVADRDADTAVEPDFESAVAFCAPEDIVAECERLLDDDAARRDLEARGRAAIRRRPVTGYLRPALLELAAR
jgi:hypothetical protein